MLATVSIFGSEDQRSIKGLSVTSAPSVSNLLSFRLGFCKPWSESLGYFVTENMFQIRYMEDFRDNSYTHSRWFRHRRDQLSWFPNREWTYLAPTDRLPTWFISRPVPGLLLGYVGDLDPDVIYGDMYDPMENRGLYLEFARLRDEVIKAGNGFEETEEVIAVITAFATKYGM